MIFQLFVPERDAQKRQGHAVYLCQYGPVKIKHGISILA